MTNQYRFESGTLSNLGREYEVFKFIDDAYLRCGKIFVKKDKPTYDDLVNEYFQQVVDRDTEVNY